MESQGNHTDFKRTGAMDRAATHGVADVDSPGRLLLYIERSLELMQLALTEAADNLPFKAPYSADAFPGP